MRTLRSAGTRAFGTAGAVTFRACMTAFGSGATFLGADAGVPRTLRAACLWAAHGAMHAVRVAVHGLPRTVHSRAAMVHPSRTVLRAAVHGVRSAMLRSVTGAAVRAAAGRPMMPTCVRAGLAMTGHRAVVLRAAMVLRTVPRAMHARSMCLRAVLRVHARLAVCRMLGVLGTFRTTAVAVTMRRVRSFMRIGFADVRRRTMPLGARAGVMRHFAMVIAVTVFTGLLIAVRSTFRLAIIVPCLVGLLVVRASIAFGTLGGVGPRERRALHAGASEAGACRWSARSAGAGSHHHAA